MSIGVSIGAITFTGSIIAFKTAGSSKWRADSILRTALVNHIIFLSLIVLTVLFSIDSSKDVF